DFLVVDELVRIADQQSGDRVRPAGPAGVAQVFDGQGEVLLASVVGVVEVAMEVDHRATSFRARRRAPCDTGVNRSSAMSSQPASRTTTRSESATPSSVRRAVSGNRGRG